MSGQGAGGRLRAPSIFAEESGEELVGGLYAVCGLFLGEAEVFRFYLQYEPAAVPLLQESSSHLLPRDLTHIQRQVKIS